nr:MAG TPA: arginine repressor [Caudoviricetes sp.]
MTKIERNEMIIKLTKENKTNAEIIDQLKSIGINVSERTIRRVLSENDSSRKMSIMSGADKIDQNGFCITAEMWESLQDRIDSLLDTMEIQSAKIQSLEADVIKASTIHSNELKSDKKYIVTRFSTREFISYANEDELNRYITVYGNRIPIATIDNGIKEKSNWVCRPDDIMITFTVQNVIDDVDLQTKILSNQHSELQNTIRDIQELMR